jgi:hypothetical protein
MKLPRLNIARVMVVVAIMALEFGVIKALLCGSNALLLFGAFPMVNIMLLAVFVAFRKPRARLFTLGFVVVGTLSLLAFFWWTENNVWTFLHYFDPPFQALDRRVGELWPRARPIIVYTILVAVFAIPHTILGLVGGCLTSVGWAMVKRGKRVAS